MLIFQILKSDFFSSLAIVQVPELLKKLREAPGINVHQVVSKSELVGPSFFQKS